MIKYPTNTIQRCIDCDGSTSLPIGQSGQDGEYGGYSSLWKFSTNTTPGDPGVNYLRIDSGLTNIYVSTTNGDNTNLAAFLASFDDTGADGNYGFIRLFKEYDSNTHKLFKLTRVNNNGTYYTLEVTFISANNSFNNNENIVLSFQPAGSDEASGFIYSNREPFEYIPLPVPGVIYSDTVTITDAGKYLILFEGNVLYGVSGSTITYQLYKNNVAITNSDRKSKQSWNIELDNSIVTLATNAGVLSLSVGDTIKIGFISTANFQLQGRSITLIQLNNLTIL
jgi:hypothetical protein